MEQQQLQSKREKSCMSHLEHGQESKDREREIRGVEYYMTLKIIFCTLPDFYYLMENRKYQIQGYTTTL